MLKSALAPGVPSKSEFKASYSTIPIVLRSWEGIPNNSDGKANDLTFTLNNQSILNIQSVMLSSFLCYNNFQNIFATTPVSITAPAGIPANVLNLTSSGAPHPLPTGYNITFTPGSYCSSTGTITAAMVHAADTAGTPPDLNKNDLRWYIIRAGFVNPLDVTQDVVSSVSLDAITGLFTINWNSTYYGPIAVSGGYLSSAFFAFPNNAGTSVTSVSVPIFGRPTVLGIATDSGDFTSDDFLFSDGDRETFLGVVPLTMAPRELIYYEPLSPLVLSSRASSRALTNFRIRLTDVSYPGEKCLAQVDKGFSWIATLWITVATRP